MDRFLIYHNPGGWRKKINNWAMMFCGVIKGVTGQSVQRMRKKLTKKVAYYKPGGIKYI
jgi:hypothetical protein